MAKKQDIRISRIGLEASGQKVKLEKMSRLPVLEAGYKAETILDQKLLGLHGGITVPLWENRNRIKQARALRRL
ncbi:MAG: hypothetical protein IH591_01340 [Bacteroidales bacterium]|nr:hypothetical protein [Bacteroidales bacterium]